MLIATFQCALFQTRRVQMFIAKCINNRFDPNRVAHSWYNCFSINIKSFRDYFMRTREVPMFIATFQCVLLQTRRVQMFIAAFH